MDSKWAYGFKDGGEIVAEYGFLTANSEEQARSSAVDAASDWFDEYGETPPDMIMWEMVPRLVGQTVIDEGEPLDGEGDKEPDEFNRVEWSPVRNGEQ